MIQPKTLSLKKQCRKPNKDGQGDNFLYHFELHQAKRPPSPHKPNPIGRDHTRILKKSDPPTEQHDHPQGHPLEQPKPQLTIPSQGHKGVGNQQQQNGVKPFHFSITFAFSVFVPLAAVAYLSYKKGTQRIFRGNCVS